MANNELDRRSAEIADTVEENEVIGNLRHVVRYQQASLIILSEDHVRRDFYIPGSKHNRTPTSLTRLLKRLKSHFHLLR